MCWREKKRVSRKFTLTWDPRTIRSGKRAPSRTHAENSKKALISCFPRISQGSNGYQKPAELGASPSDQAGKKATRFTAHALGSASKKGAAKPRPQSDRVREVAGGKPPGSIGRAGNEDCSRKKVKGGTTERRKCRGGKSGTTQSASLRTTNGGKRWGSTE